MSADHRIVSINISDGRGKKKLPVSESTIERQGLRDDGHAGFGHRQVSLLGQEAIEAFSRSANRTFAPGEFAENLTVAGLDDRKVWLLDRFRIGTALLEVTQIGKECHGGDCSVFRDVGKCVMPKRGLFCRVIEPGPVKAGDAMSFIPFDLAIRVVTLSDRVSRGDAEDRSGPRIRERLARFFSDKRWHARTDGLVIPDDRDQIMAELDRARAEGVKVVFATGGTGVGPRDVTPEAVSAFCDRMIPGVMEAIRVKFGAENPNALLSRSVAGTAGDMVVYALPGSPRAVDEYLDEILRTLEHLLLMLHDLDVHRGGV